MNFATQDFLSDVKTIFRAVTVHRPDKVQIGSRTSEEDEPLLRRLPSTEDPLLQRLQVGLYFNCFCQRYSENLPGDPVGNTENRSLTEELSRANAGRQRWENGWTVSSVQTSGRVLAHRYGVTRSFWPGQFVTEDGLAGPLRPGNRMTVLVPHESRSMQEGFYFAFGETLGDAEENHDLVRFYWNLKPSGGRFLIALLTRELNRFQVPFQLKCLTNTVHFFRLDSAVLYVSRKYFHVTARLIDRLLPELREHMAPEVPIFTKALARGLALAEDPGTGESFGLSRCRILAEAIFNTYAARTQHEEARLHEWLRLCDRDGISPERPYMNPGSVDLYDFLPASQEENR